MCMCMCMPFFGKLTTNSLAQHWARPLDGLRIQQKLAPKNYPDPLPAPPPSPSPICAFHSVRSLPLGAHPALRPRPPPLPWLAWVASPHHHAPSGREVDGALSRPSPRRNGAPNTCPDYCAFPGCSLSVREGSVRVVTPGTVCGRLQFLHLHRTCCSCMWGGSVLRAGGGARASPHSVTAG